jgi:hypothetical protein
MSLRYWSEDGFALYGRYGRRFVDDKPFFTGQVLMKAIAGEGEECSCTDRIMVVTL